MSTHPYATFPVVATFWWEQDSEILTDQLYFDSWDEAIERVEEYRANLLCWSVEYAGENLS